MARPKTLKDRRAVTLYLEGPQKAALDSLAEKTRQPWAAIVREAIDDLLKKYKPKGGAK